MLTLGQNKEMLVYFVTHGIPLNFMHVLPVTMSDSLSNHGSFRSYAYLKDLNMFDPQKLRDFYGPQRSYYTMGDR